MSTLVVVWHFQSSIERKFWTLGHPNSDTDSKPDPAETPENPFGDGSEEEVSEKVEKLEIKEKYEETTEENKVEEAGNPFGSEEENDHETSGNPFGESDEEPTQQKGESSWFFASFWTFET